jgi:tetratricopeptide (TPR) repeat protein
MFLARRLIEKNQPLEASEKLLWLLRNYPDYHLNWVFHLGLAECFYAIRQVEQAVKEYRWVIDHGPNSAARAEAATRIGDLYLNRFQYEQALGAYSIGYRYFSSDLKKFPTYYLNWGETLYQLKQFEKARTVFENFLKSHGNYPGGWRAAYRLGEIEARLSKNGLSSEIAQSWFHQTINRYPYSSGSTLARLRLLPCGQHGGFDLETQQRFFQNEAKSFSGDKEVWIKNYEDLKALSRIRSVMALGSQDQSASTAIEEYHIVKSPYVKKVLASIAHEYFRKTILAMLNEGKKLEALSEYSAKFSKLPEPEPENTYDFVLQLSRAASDLGFGELAQDLHETYEKFDQKTKKAANRTLAASNTDSHHQKNSAEEDFQDLEEQLKLAEKSFTEAKGKWMAIQGNDSGNGSENGKESRNSIRTLLGQVLDESTYAYEKELILALLEVKEKNLKSALYHVSKAQLLNSNVRVEAWLAELESQVGDSSVALNLFKKIEGKIESNRNTQFKVEDILGVPTLPSIEAVWITEAEISEKNKSWGDAAGTYSKLMEKGLGGGRVQYQYAKSLLNTGGIREKSKAREVLETLAEQPSKVGGDEFWKKLASETLATMPRRGKNE